MTQRVQESTLEQYGCGRVLSQDESCQISYTEQRDTYAILPFPFATSYYNADNSRHSDTDRHSQQGSNHSAELTAWAPSGLGSGALYIHLDIPLPKSTIDKLSLAKQAAKIRTKGIDRELDNRKGLEGFTFFYISPSSPCEK